MTRTRNSQTDVTNVFQVIYGKKPSKIIKDDKGNYLITFLNGRYPRSSSEQYFVVKITPQKYQSFRIKINQIYASYLNNLNEYNGKLKKPRWFLTPPTEKAKIISKLSAALAFKKGESKTSEVRAAKILAFRQMALKGSTMTKLSNNRDGYLLSFLKRLTLLPYFLNIAEISNSDGLKFIHHLKRTSKSKMRI